MYCKIEFKACSNILPMKNILADILQKQLVSFPSVNGSDLFDLFMCWLDLDKDDETQSPIISIPSLLLPGCNDVKICDSLWFRCKRNTGRNTNKVDLLTLHCQISLIVMLEQSMVSFKSNKEVERRKRTFSFIAASGFLSLILYLIIQKCETGVIKNICNMVCIERYKLLFSNYSFS